MMWSMWHFSCFPGASSTTVSSKPTSKNAHVAGSDIHTFEGFQCQSLAGRTSHLNGSRLFMFFLSRLHNKMRHKYHPTSGISCGSLDLGPKHLRNSAHQRGPNNPRQLHHRHHRHFQRLHPLRSVNLRDPCYYD